MTMRRETEAQKMELLKNELQRKTANLEKLVEKLEREGLTQNEKEYADECVKFIKHNAPIIKNFYRPAIVIAS